jgi:hypothetical protein
VLIVIAGAMAHWSARSDRDARRRLQVEAWHLRQLVSVPAEPHVG